MLDLAPEPGSRPGSIQRIVQLGFEVPIEVLLDDGMDTFVRVARRSFDELRVELGDRVFVSHRPAFEQQKVGAAPLY